MKNYYYPPSIVAFCFNCLMPSPLVVKAENKVSQQVAAARFFTADRLSPSWFTPDILTNNDPSKFQKRRDYLQTKMKKKYGQYQWIESIASERYRIVFENADPDTVIATFRFDWFDRIDAIDIQFNENLQKKSRVVKICLRGFDSVAGSFNSRIEFS